jgi:hypothetical protein
VKSLDKCLRREYLNLRGGNSGRLEKTENGEFFIVYGQFTGAGLYALCEGYSSVCSGITALIVQLSAIAHIPTIGMIKLRRLG